ncbi:hypothetical protein O6H91_08G049100 [Diphasiastrum complanatum]|nr:hypothetical protein O6H91_08G049100 [Diphasiastrum complanatum]KAJ7546657.1 hypothetical protein O6H91_08G049100 [Diphasiastrum complanatum]
MRVMYRKGPEGTPFHTYCIEGTINGPMVNALCVGWEAPSYKEWWPQISVPTFEVVESRWVKRIRVGEDVSLIRVKVPWPLAAREVLMTAFELEYFEQDLILVLLGTASNSTQVDVLTSGLSPDDIPPAEQNVVRMDVAGGYVLQKMTSDKSYFRTVLDLDIKLDFVPPWLINFISRQLVGLGYKLFQKTILSTTSGKAGGKSFQLYMEKEALYRRIKIGLQAHNQTPEMPLILDEESHASFIDKSKETTSQGHVESVLTSAVSMAPPKGTDMQGDGLSSRGSVMEPQSTQHLSEQGKTKSQPSSPKEESSDATGLHISMKAGDESCEIVQAVEFRDPQVRKALDALDKMISIVRSLTAEVESGGVIFSGKYQNHLPPVQFASSFSSGHATSGNDNSKHEKQIESSKKIRSNANAALQQSGMENGHISDITNDGAMGLVNKPENDTFNEEKEFSKRQWCCSCLPLNFKKEHVGN